MSRCSSCSCRCRHWMPAVFALSWAGSPDIPVPRRCSRSWRRWPRGRVAPPRRSTPPARGCRGARRSSYKYFELLAPHTRGRGSATSQLDEGAQRFRVLQRITAHRLIRIDAREDALHRYLALFAVECAWYRLDYEESVGHMSRRKLRTQRLLQLRCHL